jgi:hypothetical protein
MKDVFAQMYALGIAPTGSDTKTDSQTLKSSDLIERAIRRAKEIRRRWRDSHESLILPLAACGATGIFRRRRERRMPLRRCWTDSETSRTLMFARVLAVVSPVSGQL